jgi:hypothetical protein
MFHDYVLAAPMIGADETTWRLLGEEGGGMAHSGWDEMRIAALKKREAPLERRTRTTARTGPLGFCMAAF